MLNKQRKTSKYIKSAIMAMPYGQSIKRATEHVSRRRIKKALNKRGMTFNRLDQLVSFDCLEAERRMLATIHTVSPNVVHAMDSSISGLHHWASLMGGHVKEINALGATIVDGRNRIYHVTH